MELRLEQLIKDCGRISNVRNLDANNPIVLRLSHPTNATVHVIACAVREPHDLVLPLNVTWFNLDPQSLDYLSALVRVSKDPNVSAATHHTWVKVYNYDDVFVNQEYDAADTLLLTDNTAIPPAQPTILGTARLSVAAEVSSNPIVVGDNDPRLTDARMPVSHTHPQEPAQQLKTSVGNVTISGSAAPEPGMTLVALDANRAEWRRLRTSDITN